MSATVQLNLVQDEIVTIFTEIVSVLGIPKSVGQIYGLLFASPEALSFTDIQGRLGISKGSVSQGLNLLKSLGAVKPAGNGHANGENGVRREYWVPELGLRRLITGIIIDKIEPRLDSGQSQMAELKGKLKGLRDSDIEEEKLETLEDRLEQLETWRKRTKAMMPVIRAFVALKRK